MDLTINYSGVSKSAALENHIEYNLNKLQEKDDLDRSRVKVWLDKESAYLSRGLPEFQTRIQVKKPGLKKLFVEAKSSQLADSINQAAERIQKRIIKTKEKGGRNEQKVKRARKRAI